MTSIFQSFWPSSPYASVITPGSLPSQRSLMTFSSALNYFYFVKHLLRLVPLPEEQESPGWQGVVVRFPNPHLLLKVSKACEIEKLTGQRVAGFRRTKKCPRTFCCRRFANLRQKCRLDAYLQIRNKKTLFCKRATTCYFPQQLHLKYFCSDLGCMLFNVSGNFLSLRCKRNDVIICPDLDERNCLSSRAE